MTKLNEVSDACWNEWISRKAVANAGVVVVNSKNQVLLLFKPKTGEWEIPSGGIDRKEEPKDAALRELKEETRIIIDKKQLRELKTVTSKPDKGKTDIIVTFLAYPVDEKVLIGEEHSKFDWVSFLEYGITGYPINDATKEQIESARNKILGRSINA